MDSSERWDVPGKWSVSRYNFADEVVADHDFFEPFVLADITVGKMGHLSGSRVFSAEEQVEVAELLDAMGVQYLCTVPMHYFGTPRQKGIIDGVSAIAKRGFRFKIEAQALYVKPDPDLYLEWIDRLIDIGVNVVVVGYPLPGAKLQASGVPGRLTEWSQEKVFEECVRALDHIKRRGAQPAVAISDGIRPPLEGTIPILNSLIDAGAELIRVSDGFGVLSPQGTRYFYRKLREGLRKRVPIIHHVHDDFGMGTAQAIAAATGGCWPNVAINGIGERASADMAQVVLALEALYGVDTGIRLDMLAEASKLVERITGVRLQPHRPVVGETMFVPQFPEEYAALFRDRGPWKVTPVVPEVVGQRPQVYWWEGMMTDDTITAKLEQLGLAYREEHVAQVAEEVRKRLRKIEGFPAWLPDSEAEEICRQVVA